MIADVYAASGDYLVYLPDFFAGDPMKLKFANVAIPVDASRQSSLSKYSGLLASMPSLLLWLGRHKEEPTWEYCRKFLDALRRDTYGKVKIGMSGFCWGGRYAIRAGQTSSNIQIGGQVVPLVDAVVALHPSNLELPRDVNAPSVAVPLSIAWGEDDEMVSIKQRGQIEDIFEKLSQSGTSLPVVEHRTYKPGRHGFAVRGNPDNPVERSVSYYSIMWSGLETDLRTDS